MRKWYEETLCIFLILEKIGRKRFYRTGVGEGRNHWETGLEEYRREDMFCSPVLAWASQSETFFCKQCFDSMYVPSLVEADYSFHKY